MKKHKLITTLLLSLLVGCTTNPKNTTTTNINSSFFSTNNSSSTVNKLSDIPEPEKPEIREYSTTMFAYKEVEEYYAGIEGLFGWRLKWALNEIIRGHDKISYDGPSGITYQNFYRELDADPLNPSNMILLYSGSADKETPFDREHVWPKSLGLGGNDYKSYLTGVDVHNLRPALSSINSTRGNREWDKNATRTNDNLLGNKYETNFFEPLNQFKGDIARTIFYMATRYEGKEKINGVAHDLVDLELVEAVGNTYASESKAYLGNVKTLLEWNIIDPVDQTEVQRNELIYSKYQHNRNPFIDYPEFADMIFNPDYNGPTASIDNPTSKRSDLPSSLNSGRQNIIQGETVVSTYLKNASGVGTGYAQNVNKTFTVNSLSMTMSVGLKSGDSFTLGTNGTSTAKDSLSSIFNRQGTSIDANGSSLIINEDFSDINAVELKYANPAAASIATYHIFRSLDGGNTFYPVSTWSGYDVFLQRGCVFSVAPSARFAVVISGPNNPRLSLVSLIFYKNASLS